MTSYEQLVENCKVMVSLVKPNVTVESRDFSIMFIERGELIGTIRPGFELQFFDVNRYGVAPLPTGKCKTVFSLASAVREVFGWNEYFNVEYGLPIAAFKLANSGENPEGYIAVASRSGDFKPETGDVIYGEVNIGVYKPGDNARLVDVLVGLSGDTGEPCVYVSTDGNGDSQNLLIYPMRELDKAVQRLN